MCLITSWTVSYTHLDVYKRQVFVHESKDLVNLLMQVDLDAHIPPELYLAIAEILAWIYRLEAEKAQSLHAEKFEEKIENWR